MSFTDVLVSIMDNYNARGIKRNVEDRIITELTAPLRPESTNLYHDGTFMDRFVAMLPVEGGDVKVGFCTKSDFLDVKPMYVWQVELYFESGLYFPDRNVFREAAIDGRPMVYETEHGNLVCTDSIRSIEFIAGDKLLEGTLTVSMRGIRRLDALEDAVRAGIFDSFFRHVQYTGIDEHLQGGRYGSE